MAVAASDLVAVCAFLWLAKQSSVESTTAPILIFKQVAGEVTRGDGTILRQWTRQSAKAIGLFGRVSGLDAAAKAAMAGAKIGRVFGGDELVASEWI